MRLWNFGRQLVPATPYKKGADESHSCYSSRRNGEAEGKTKVVDGIAHQRCQNAAAFHSTEVVNAQYRGAVAFRGIGDDIGFRYWHPEIYYHADAN